MPLSTLDTWADGHALRRRLAFPALFLLALILLGVGITQHTGITGKDEYYLGLRTPMCMVEQDVWLVPCLDGAARLKKPPMLYWLTRASYEAFGVSLFSARLVAITLSALLVLGIALIAWEQGRTLGHSLLAGLIGLSFLSIFVSGRMLELDVPVAAFSTLAFLFLLRWYRRNQPWALIPAAGLLAAGFLTKGPVVLIVAGAGGLALLASDTEARRYVARHWLAFGGAWLLFALLALPWFYHVGQLYPDQSAQDLSTELSARRFLQLSPVPLYGILMLTLPWSFVLMERLSGLRRGDPEQRARALQLALWLSLTLLPFFFIRTFERYLIGSLVPAALLLAHMMAQGAAPALPSWRWAARAGMLISLALCVPLILLAGWLSGAVIPLLAGAAALAWFIRQWWMARQPAAMASSAILLWVSVLGLAYPHLGINAIPADVVATARQRAVVFYHGPQPGLLPAVLGRSLRHVNDQWRLPDELRRPCASFLLFAQQDEANRAIAGLSALGFQAEESRRFGVLSSRVSWGRMARRGITPDELLSALAQRDLTPIKPQVIMYEVSQPQCPAP